MKTVDNRKDLGHRAGETVHNRESGNHESAAVISATGTVEPEEVVDINAQVAEVIDLFGKDADGKPEDCGSPVEEGTVLARIDNSLYAAVG